jgi:hypothetical protein
MNGIRAIGGAVLVLAVLNLFAGCASVPSKPITDIRVIGDTWAGTTSVGLGPPEFYYLTINPGARIIAEWG